MNVIPAQVRIHVRPVRHAYFLKENDYQSFHEIVRASTSQWGGLYNVIIPVSEQLEINPLFSHILALYEPDRFVCYLPNSEYQLEVMSPLQNAIKQVLPHRKISILGGDYFLEHDMSAHPLLIVGPNPSSRVFNTWQTDKKNAFHDLILAAIFGDMIPDQIPSYEEHANISLSQLLIDSETFLHEQMSTDLYRSPINFTTCLVRPHSVGGYSDSPHFDIVVTSSLYGLCAYWSFRAMREACSFQNEIRRTMLIQPDFLDKPDLISLLADHIRAAPLMEGKSCNIDLRFWYDDPSVHQKLRILTSQFPAFVKHNEKKITFSSWFGGKKQPRELDRTRQLVFAEGHPFFGKPFATGLGRVPFERHTSIQLGDNEIFFEPPDDMSHYKGGGVVIDWNIDYWKRFPKHDSFSDLIVKNGWWSSNGIAATYESSRFPHYLPFSLPPDIEILKKFFESHKYEIGLSKPGEYATALVSSIGGLHNISIFASQLGYAICQQLSVGTTKKIAQHLAQICGLKDVAAQEQILSALTQLAVIPEVSRAGRTIDDLSSQIKGFSKRDILDKLSSLASKGLLRRGFRLDCPKCTSIDWFPLNSTGETVICLGCAHEFPLPVTKGPGEEIRWHYLLNSLLERVMDHDVLPSLLALYRTVKQPELSMTIPGLDLIVDGRVVCDLDYLAIVDHNIWGGECKAGTELAEKDIQIARIASNCGFAEFHFCTTKEFSNKSKTMVKALRSELKNSKSPMAIKILQAADLFDGDPKPVTANVPSKRKLKD